MNRKTTHIFDEKRKKNKTLTILTLPQSTEKSFYGNPKSAHLSTKNRIIAQKNGKTVNGRKF